jgi:major membrane immunogen (membrane-anchored lipoprotein)
VTDIHADIEALKEFADTLVRYRHAQRAVADRADYQVAATRASLEEKESQWRALLARRRADLTACQRAADEGGHADCSAEELAVREAEERLEQIRRWQQRVADEAVVFRGAASRFRNLLDRDLPQAESKLRDVVSGLEAARRIRP